MRTETVKYFTTRYTRQMTVCSLMYSGMNIMMHDFFDGAALEMCIIVILQTGFLNSLLNYLFFGILRNDAIKRKAILLSTLILGNSLLVLTMGAYSVFAHIVAGFVLAAVFGRALRRSNGDNLYTDDDVFEPANAPMLQGIRVFFPVDMGNKYKKPGIIDGVGKAVQGKHAGKVIAVICYQGKTADEKYVCPLRQIKISNSTDEILADVYSCERALLYGEN